MSCPTPVLAAAVGDQRHTEHQILVDRAAAVADVAGEVAGDHRALREPDEHIAGQRAAVVHVGHRLDRGAGALGAAVVVGHLLVRRERIVELRGVGNRVDLDAVGAELRPDRVGDVEQQRDRELRRVERIVGAATTPRCPGSTISWTSGQLASWNSGRGFCVGPAAPVGGTARRRDARSAAMSGRRTTITMIATISADDHGDRTGRDQREDAVAFAPGFGPGVRAIEVGVVFLLAESFGGDANVVGGRGLSTWDRRPGSPTAGPASVDVAAHHRRDEVPHRLIALPGGVGLADVGADAQRLQLARRLHAGGRQRVEDRRCWAGSRQSVRGLHLVARRAGGVRGVAVTAGCRPGRRRGHQILAGAAADQQPCGQPRPQHQDDQRRTAPCVPALADRWLPRAARLHGTGCAVRRPEPLAQSADGDIGRGRYLMAAATVRPTSRPAAPPSCPSRARRRSGSRSARCGRRRER